MLAGQIAKARSLENIWADICVRGSRNAEMEFRRNVAWDLQKRLVNNVLDIRESQSKYLIKPVLGGPLYLFINEHTLFCMFI